MINFKRGSTKVVDGKPKDGTWKDVILEDGQPGYDRTSNRLKIGDGHSKWEALKWLKGGLEANQVLDSENHAKTRYKNNNEDTTIFTYGKAAPADDLVGQVYFHQYDGPVEADYVIEQGFSGIWSYRKWKSGISECWGTKVLKTSVEKQLDSSDLYYNAAYTMDAVNYPNGLFKNTPVETASVTSNSNYLVWLASKSTNTSAHTAKYSIVKGATATHSVQDFYIHIEAKGYWY